MKESLLEKHEFMQQYVLNRALTSPHLDGYKASIEAREAWSTIMKECNK